MSSSSPAQVSRHRSQLFACPPDFLWSRAYDRCLHHRPPHRRSLDLYQPRRRRSRTPRGKPRTARAGSLCPSFLGCERSGDWRLCAVWEFGAVAVAGALLLSWRSERADTDALVLLAWKHQRQVRQGGPGRHRNLWSGCVSPRLSRHKSRTDYLCEQGISEAHIGGGERVDEPRRRLEQASAENRGGCRGGLRHAGVRMEGKALE